MNKLSTLTALVIAALIVTMAESAWTSKTKTIEAAVPAEQEAAAPRRAGIVLVENRQVALR